MAYGFVYLLCNDAMPGYYKIGMTDRAPQQRVDELSKSTAIPVPFKIVCYAEVEDALSVEQCLHEEYEPYRINNAREFFIFDRDLVQECIFSIQGWSVNFCPANSEWHLNGLFIEELKKKKLEHFFSQCAEPIVFTKKSIAFDIEDVI